MKTKLFLGILLYNYRYELWYLCSFIGSFLALKSVSNNLLELPENSESYILFKHFIDKIKITKESFGKKDIYDFMFNIKHELKEDFRKSDEDVNKQNYDKNYVVNDYFIKNRDILKRMKYLDDWET